MEHGYCDDRELLQKLTEYKWFSARNEPLGRKNKKPFNRTKLTAMISQRSPDSHNGLGQVVGSYSISKNISVERLWQVLQTECVCTCVCGFLLYFFASAPLNLGS